jgi:uncharacterized membrane-anchored protein YitT (DUF2179 family)
MGEKLIRALLALFGDKTEEAQSGYVEAKHFLRLKINVISLLKSLGFMSAGILCAGFGLKGFLLPNDFIDGGVTGISLLVSKVSGINLAYLIVVINIPFLIMGYKQMGRNFALKSIIAILGLALIIGFFPYPVITADKLLVAAFGGFFLGAGIGLAMRGGAVIDGTEVLAVYVSKITSLTVGDVILVFNVMIFGVASYLLSIEIALYAILTYLAAAKTVDFIVEGVEEYLGVTIISAHSNEIRLLITEEMRRGVTLYQGKQGYGKNLENLGATDIVFTVITRLEIAKLKKEVKKIDPNAFMVMTTVKDTKGGIIKRRALKT